MNRNVRWWDRTLRFILGVLFLSYALAGGPWWAYLGLMGIGTAAWGFCPVYWTFKINSSK